jgi:hypothetical protein
MRSVSYVLFFRGDSGDGGEIKYWCGFPHHRSRHRSSFSGDKTMSCVIETPLCGGGFFVTAHPLAVNTAVMRRAFIYEAFTLVTSITAKKKYIGIVNRLYEHCKITRRASPITEGRETNAEH